jgi:hypothetical protein
LPAPTRTLIASATAPALSNLRGVARLVRAVIGTKKHVGASSSSINALRSAMIEWTVIGTSAQPTSQAGAYTT